jgi:hypothetical protein
MKFSSIFSHPKFKEFKSRKKSFETEKYISHVVER